MASKSSSTKSSRSKRKKSSSSMSAREELKQEIRHLGQAIEDLHEDVQRLSPPHPAKRALVNLANGAMKGLGFLIGTTILAAVIVWAVQQALKSEEVRQWIDDRIENVVSQSVNRALENAEPSDFNIRLR